MRIPWLPNQYTSAIAARIEGLSSGINATTLKKPLKRIQVHCNANAYINPRHTTIIVDALATKRL